ncbi:MAG: TonB family protein [Caulobacter sp.]
MGFWIAAMMAAAAAATPCPEGGDPSIAPTRPNWKTPLSADRIWWAYPPAAVAANKGGKAIIHCDIDAQGLTTTCEVVSETPADFGFGEAALSLRHDMLFIPATRCGKAVPSEVTIPITFAVPEDMPETKAKAEARAALPPPPAEALALGKRLAAAMGVSEGVERLMEIAIQQRMQDGAADPSPEERRAYYEAMQTTKPVIREAVVESAGTALARELSMDELKGSLAFFEGPLGTALRARSEKLEEAIQGDMTALQEKFQQAFDDRYCEILKNCEVQKALKALH